MIIMDTFALLLNDLRQKGIQHLRSDSQEVQPGDAFIAWPGLANDARNFVSNAIEKGASICVVDRHGVEKFHFDSEKIIAISNLKVHAGQLAQAFYHHPSKALKLIGVTGTNGKTSTTCWLAQALSQVPKSPNSPCAIIGTLGAGSVKDGWQAIAHQRTGFTTPDPIRLAALLHEFKIQGLNACALEASSIGLEEERLNALSFEVAVFTNLTQDHLDYHGSMERYWLAKKRLFFWPELQAAVINIDDVNGFALAKELKATRKTALWTVSRAGNAAAIGASLWARNITYTAQGLSFEVVDGQVSLSLSLSTTLLGDYNVSNLLCVIACLRALGLSLQEAITACHNLSPIPGRMEALLGQPTVVIDYAHTPDALDKAINALIPVAKQRRGALWTVFGCGGNRDPLKRPLMGEIAFEKSDHMVVTSDNPRGEDPQTIIDQILKGVASSANKATQAPQPKARIYQEIDRKQAIFYAIKNASINDVILIAGKGHESTQEIAGVKNYFSDQVVAAQALSTLINTKGGLT